MMPRHFKMLMGRVNVVIESSDIFGKYLEPSRHLWIMSHET